MVVQNRRIHHGLAVFSGCFISDDVTEINAPITGKIRMQGQIQQTGLRGIIGHCRHVGDRSQAAVTQAQMLHAAGKFIDQNFVITDEFKRPRLFESRNNNIQPRVTLIDGSQTGQITMIRRWLSGLTLPRCVWLLRLICWLGGAGVRGTVGAARIRGLDRSRARLASGCGSSIRIGAVIAGAEASKSEQQQQQAMTMLPCSFEGNNKHLRAHSAPCNSGRSMTGRQRCRRAQNLSGTDLSRIFKAVSKDKIIRIFKFDKRRTAVADGSIDRAIAIAIQFGSEQHFFDDRVADAGDKQACRCRSGHWPGPTAPSRCWPAPH